MTTIPDPTTAYLYICASRVGEVSPVARTIGIPPSLNVDLDDDGHVLGIESLAGPIGVAELIAVLRAVRVAGSWPTRG